MLYALVCKKCELCFGFFFCLNCGTSETKSSLEDVAETWGCHDNESGEEAIISEVSGCGLTLVSSCKLIAVVTFKPFTDITAGRHFLYSEKQKIKLLIHLGDVLGVLGTCPCCILAD